MFFASIPNLLHQDRGHLWVPGMVWYRDQASNPPPPLLKLAGHPHSWPLARNASRQTASEFRSKDRRIEGFRVLLVPSSS